MKLRTIIVDDEPKSVRLLQSYLSGFESLDILPSAGNATEAYSLINRYDPHVVFLDISMPGENAFDLLNRFSSRNFEVIFTTAYDEYALKAFEKQALHYLLKPIDQEKLSGAVERCVSFYRTKENTNPPAAEIKKIPVPVANGHILLNPDQIIRCEGDGNYTTIYTNEDRKFMISQNIKVVEERLFGYGFFRVHKRHLINLSFVEGFSSGKGGYLTLLNTSRIPISFRKKSEFVQLLQKRK